MYGRPGGMDCSADTTDTILLLDYEEKRKQIEKKSESHDAVGSGIVAFFVSYADTVSAIPQQISQFSCFSPSYIDVFLAKLVQMHSNMAFKTSLYSKNCENRTNHLLLEY